IYSECDGTPEAEQACNSKRLKEAKDSKVKAQIFDHLLYRHWDSYREGKRTHLFVVAIDECVGTAASAAQRGEAERGCPHAAPLDLTPGDFDAPVFSVGGQDNYAFSPDGQEICYASNHDKNPAASTNNDLWIVPVSGGADNVGTGHVGAAAPAAQVLAQTKNITADNPASDSTPLYSPDGRYIAYRAQQRPGYEADRFRLMLYDRKTGEKKNLTEDFDRWVGTYVWSPDSKTIYFSAEESGGVPIFRLWLEGEGARQVDSMRNPRSAASPGRKDSYIRRTEFGFNDDLAVSPDGKRLLFTRMALTHPTEIYVRDISIPFSLSGAVGNTDALDSSTALTGINDGLLSLIAMPPIQAFDFVGAHGDRVEGFLVKPPNFDPSKKYPVKFLIHGGPQGAWGDDWSYRWNPELFAAP